MKWRNFSHLLLVVLFFSASEVATSADSNIPTAYYGYGILSYTFFNLSGNDCTLTAYGSGGNPYAYSGWAQENGWGNFSVSSVKDSIDNGSFFNNYGLTNIAVDYDYLFFNNYDPIDTSTLSFNSPQSTGVGKVSNGQAQEMLWEYSTELGPVSGNQSINYAAFGDSWTIDCGNPQPIAFANLASSAAGLVSGGPTQYPYDVSPPATQYNAWLNPTAWGGTDVYGPCSANDAWNTNICGVGFTATYADAGNQILNWNLYVDPANISTSDGTVGGLWTGINYLGVGGSGASMETYPAAGMLNMPMPAINFSPYTIAQNYGDPGSFNYTTQFGGHFTVALGDPFVISSFGAKSLWYLVRNTTLSDDTTLASLASVLSNTTSGVFKTTYPSNVYGDNYIQWLLGSQASTQNYTGAPQLAALAFNQTLSNIAAAESEPHKSVWGAVLRNLLGLAANMLTDGLFSYAANVTTSNVGKSVWGGVEGATGTVVADVGSLIWNGNTSASALPLTVNAPVVTNATYASTNLMGLFLANSIVPSQMDPSTNNYLNFTNNYSIATESECGNISVTNNIITGNCNGNDNGGDSGALSYTNVNSQGTTQNQLSIWTAILTGSDVTTNPDGFIILGNPISGISFSAPVMMWNASGSAALPENLGVATSFSLQYGYVTANGYAIALDPATSGTNAAPSAEPQITYQQVGKPAAGVAFTPLGGSGIQYDSQTGVLTITSYTVNGTQYDFGNGTQTINMTGCPPNSTVVVFVTPNVGSTTASGASGSLSCGPYSVLSPAPTLDYAQCVNDPWATGGVIAAFTTAPDATTGQGGVVELACACMPQYIGGAANNQTSQTLGGIVVGATSTNTKQTCPLPQT